jgi:hypothetical protein
MSPRSALLVLGTIVDWTESSSGDDIVANGVNPEKAG